MASLNPPTTTNANINENDVPVSDRVSEYSLSPSIAAFLGCGAGVGELVAA